MSRLVLAALLVAATAHAKDAFDDVTCGKDVVAAMLHKQIPREAVVKIEAAHTAIGLHGLGGDGEDDPYFLSLWTICGDTYVLLGDAAHPKNRDLVMDARKLLAETPTRKLRMPGTCHAGARTLDDVFYYIDPATKIVSHAWQVDAQKMKLVQLDAAGLTCPVEW